MRKLPSAWSVIWRDNVSTAMAASTPWILFVGVMVKVTGTVPGRRGGPDRPVDPEVATAVLAGAVTLTLFLAAIIARRVARTRRLYAEGREVEARVTRFRDARASKVEFEFEVHGIPYKVRKTFLRSRETPTFSQGTQISVLVDPDNPKNAIPLGLYGNAN